MLHAIITAFARPGGPYLYLTLVTAVSAVGAIARLIPFRRKQVPGYRCRVPGALWLPPGARHRFRPGQRTSPLPPQPDNGHSRHIHALSGPESTQITTRNFSPVPASEGRRYRQVPERPRPDHWAAARQGQPGQRHAEDPRAWQGAAAHPPIEVMPGIRQRREDHPPDARRYQGQARRAGPGSRSQCDYRLDDEHGTDHDQCDAYEMAARAYARAEPTGSRRAAAHR
jgi:hypothetical protein